jgi:hypothetical protein
VLTAGGQVQPIVIPLPSECEFSLVDQQESSIHSRENEFWPAPFWFSGRLAFGIIAGIVAVFWVIFIVHDLIRTSGETVLNPMWAELFDNQGPIEWLQWFVLVIAVVLSGFLAGKLTGGPSRFFLLMAFSIALIFLEDASDLRFMLYLEYASKWLGSDVGGVATRVFSDTVYSALILVLPTYTLVRYGRYIWPERGPRNYMLAGFGFYAIATGLSALRHVDGFYQDLGEAIDTWLMFGRWPSSVYVPPDMTYFYVVDAFLKENLEIFGAASFLAMILAYASLHRAPGTPLDRPGMTTAPGILRVQARTSFLIIAGFIAIIWLLVLLVDLIQVSDGPLERPVWEQAFHNNRPAEWVQWATLLTGAILSANLAARMHGNPARFFFLMAFALALIFFEDTSDLRHVFYHEYWVSHFGDDISGIPTRVVSDTIYFSAIATVPLYAVARYGLSVWPVRSTRYFLIAGFVLYALAGGLSAIRHLNDLYINIGAWIDENLFFSRWPSAEHISQERAHFYVMDSFIEETWETLGAACLLAMVLAYATYWRKESEASATPPDDLPRLDPRIAALRDSALPDRTRS